MFGIPAGCQPQRDSIDVISVEFRADVYEEFAIHVGEWQRPAGTPARVPSVPVALIRWCRYAQPPARRIPRLRKDLIAAL